MQGIHRHDPVPCPACGSIVDATTCVTDDAKPVPGDISICCACCATLAFTDDLTYRIFTEDEIQQLPTKSLTQLFAAKVVVLKHMKAMRAEKDGSP